jgi:hypothetical protein
VGVAAGSGPDGIVGETGPPKPLTGFNGMR